MAAEDADDVDDEAEVPFGLVDPSNILVLNMVYHTDIPSAYKSTLDKVGRGFGGGGMKYKKRGAGIVLFSLFCHWYLLIIKRQTKDINSTIKCDPWRFDHLFLIMSRKVIYRIRFVAGNFFGFYYERTAH